MIEIVKMDLTSDFADLVQPRGLFNPEHIQAGPHLQVEPPPQPFRLCQGGHPWHLPQPRSLSHDSRIVFLTSG